MGLHAWTLHVRILARDFSLVAQCHAGAMLLHSSTLAIEWTHWGLSPGPDTTTPCALEWRCTLRAFLFARDACTGNSQALT